MKNLKKLLVLVLAVVMCLTALSVTSFAADFEPKVYLNRRYDNTGSKMYLSVTTDKAYGAIKATLEYTAGVTFDLSNSKFDENAAKDYMYKAGTNSITFVVATDNLTAGSTAWADLAFDLGALDTATFTLKDISVANINEDINTNAIPVATKTITVKNVLNSLGAQYRTTAPALRFGAKLIRNQADNAITGGTAVACGYIVGYTDVLDANSAELGATLNGDQIVVTNANAMVNIPSTKWLQNEETYMIYSVAVKYGENSANLNREVQVKPYTICKAADGSYEIIWGDVIKNSFNNVKNSYDLMTKVA